jgi:hypothetical protein
VIIFLQNSQEWLNTHGAFSRVRFKVCLRELCEVIFTYELINASSVPQWAYPLWVLQERDLDAQSSKFAAFLGSSVQHEPRSELVLSLFLGMSFDSSFNHLSRAVGASVDVTVAASQLAVKVIISTSTGFSVVISLAWAMTHVGCNAHPVAISRFHSGPTRCGVSLGWIWMRNQVRLLASWCLWCSRFLARPWLSTTCQSWIPSWEAFQCGQLASFEPCVPFVSYAS